MTALLILAAATTATVLQATVRDPRYSSISAAPEIVQRYPSGLETFKVVVSPEAVALSCEATIQGIGQVSDVLNCKKVMRFAFTPATDQNGVKVFGTATFFVTWQVLRGEKSRFRPSVPPQFSPDFSLPLNHLPAGAHSEAVSGLLLVVDGAGKVEICFVAKSSGVAALDQAACHAVAGAGVTPVKNNAGTPVRAVYSIGVGFTVRP